MTEENILARYTIQRELGRGTLGAVYAARDRGRATRCFGQNRRN